MTFTRRLRQLMPQSISTGIGNLEPERGFVRGSRLSESEITTPALDASPGDNCTTLEQPLQRAMGPRPAHLRRTTKRTS